MSTSRPRRTFAVLTTTALLWAGGASLAAAQTEDGTPEDGTQEVEPQQDPDGEQAPEGGEQAPDGEEGDPLGGVLGEEEGDGEATEEEDLDGEADAFGDEADTFTEDDDAVPTGGVDAGFGGLAEGGTTGATAISLATALLGAAAAAWFAAARRFGLVTA